MGGARGAVTGAWSTRRLVVAVLLGAVALQVLFVVGVVAAQLVPDRGIVTELSTAADQDEFRTDYPRDGIGGMRDGYTECLALGTGLNAPGDRGLLARTIYSAELGEYAPDGGECAQTRVAIQALADGGEAPGWSYARYWHGYVVVTRPALWLVGVKGLRSGVLLIFTCALALAVFGLATRLGRPVAVALLLPLLAATNVLSTPGADITHALTWSVILASVGLITLVTHRWGWGRGTATVAVSGATFAYVDLLTTPAAAWALCAFSAAATVAVAGARLGDVTRSLVAAGLAWPTAYALTWATKWLLAVLLVDRQFLTQVRDVAEHRMSDATPAVNLAPGASSLTNWSYWWDTIASAKLVLPTAIIVVVAVIVVLLRRRDRRALALFALLSLPALLVPLWYEVLRNHSQEHVFFTYRSVPVAVGVVVAAAVVALRSTRSHPSGPGGTPAPAGSQVTEAPVGGIRAD